MDTTQLTAYYRDLGDDALVAACAEGPAAYEAAAWQVIAAEVARRGLSEQAVNLHVAYREQVLSTQEPEMLRDHLVSQLEAAEKRSQRGTGYVVVGILVTGGTFLISRHLGFYLVAWGAMLYGFLEMAYAAGARERAKKAVEAFDASRAGSGF